MRRGGRALLGAVSLSWGCLGRPPVTRVVDGEVLEGRPIEPAAYAAYLRAELLDARGDARGALAELERAHDEDPKSPDILTRIAEIRCRPQDSSAARGSAPEGAFEKALELDPTFAPAWLGLAECRALHADLEAALEAAERAVKYDPENSRTTATMARVLFALERPHHAWIWLDALASFAPESAEAQLALLKEAVLRRDTAREQRARRALAKLAHADAATGELELDDALRQGDLPRARLLASTLRVAPGALALRALVASPVLARDQAWLVLDADPSDSDAWIAALVAADALGDDTRFAEASRLLTAEPLAPSTRGLELFAELLARRAGRDAAEAFGGSRNTR